MKPARSWPKRILRATLAVAIVSTLAVAVYVKSVQPAPLDRVEPPRPSSFASALVAKGAQLAAIGNCRACHTAPGSSEADYAGDRAIATPFGTVYSSNITPAPGDGIGRWSEAAFSRAMRQGISRGGRRLYPAFPYDHFARLDDSDIAAVYAFLMTRRPIETYQNANDLIFPLGKRWLLSFWNALFFRPQQFRLDPNRSAEWNRGAYLVEGLGHCGACHTPRNLLGAEARGRELDGGKAEGWDAPALDAASPAPVPWDSAHLFQYLRTGWDAEHGAAAGPMREVTDDLAHADDGDVRAIAAYIVAQQREASAARRDRGDKALAQAARREPPSPNPGEEAAAALYTGACARCHTGSAAAAAPKDIDLALSTAISAADPRNAIHIVLDGIPPQGEQAGPLMPPFAGAFTDAQVAALLAYVRAHFSPGPAWSDLESRVRNIRSASRQNTAATRTE